MKKSALLISKTTQRQFVLGKQGLFPGRRWRGKEGALQALRESCVVQIDPLNVVARSHDLALYGRVLDYQPAQLEELLYQDRAGFDYGGTVMVHPMQELPYWRAVMQRKFHEPRWQAFAAEHASAVETVRTAVQERGPLGVKDFEGSPIGRWNYRSNKDTGYALYYLWLGGELMTHSRRGFQRMYDLRQRIAPPEFDYAVSPAEAEHFFALKALRETGIARLLGWKNRFAGLIERKVELAEASARLEALVEAEQVVTVELEGDPKTPYYLLAEYLPVLEKLQAGELPQAWQPLETTNEQEVIFLAPLEIASARGRAKALFDFEYLWEVYKPQQQRRWGYYTLPILYGDRLVARLDPKVERSSRTLWIKGFWLEPGTRLDEPFLAALAAGLKRLLRLSGMEQIDFAADIPFIFQST